MVRCDARSPRCRRCRAATLAHGAMPMPGQRVGGYLHGYLLTIGPSCRPSVVSYLVERAGFELLRAGGGKGGGGGGVCPVLGRGVLVVGNSPSYPSQIFLLK
jgi:hypothetical protein